MSLRGGEIGTRVPVGSGTGVPTARPRTAPRRVLANRAADDRRGHDELPVVPAAHRSLARPGRVPVGPFATVPNVVTAGPHRGRGADRRHRRRAGRPRAARRGVRRLLGRRHRRRLVGPAARSGDPGRRRLRHRVRPGVHRRSCASAWSRRSRRCSPSSSCSSCRSWCSTRCCRWRSCAGRCSAPTTSTSSTGGCGSSTGRRSRRRPTPRAWSGALALGCGRRRVRRRRRGAGGQGLVGPPRRPAARRGGTVNWLGESALAAAVGRRLRAAPAGQRRGLRADRRRPHPRRRGGGRGPRAGRRARPSASWCCSRRPDAGRVGCMPGSRGRARGPRGAMAGRVCGLMTPAAYRPAHGPGLRRRSACRRSPWSASWPARPASGGGSSVRSAWSAGRPGSPSWPCPRSTPCV